VRIVWWFDRTAKREYFEQQTNKEKEMTKSNQKNEIKENE
jgi:hypothetical protein